MPKRRMFKKKTYKRRSRRGRGRLTTMRRVRGVLPDKMQVRLTYTQQGQLTSGVVTYTSIIVRGNSIFDPDFTGVGGQPFGRDEWSGFYDNYRVFASKIRVFFDSEDAGDGLIGVVVPSTSSTGFSSTNLAMQTPYSRFKHMGVSTGTNAKTVSNYMESSKIFGIKAINYDTSFAAAFGANPAQEWFWHVGVGSADSVGTPTSNYTLKIVYYVELYGRKQLALS